MKVFVEPIYYSGHVGFVAGYLSNQDINESLYVLPILYKSHLIPSLIERSVFYETKYYQGSLSGIKNRLIFVRNYWRIKQLLKSVQYNEIEFLSFDEITFGLLGIKNCKLILHNNLAKSVNSFVKMFFLKRLSRNNVMLSLDLRQREFVIKNLDGHSIEISHPKRLLKNLRPNIFDKPYLLFINSLSTDKGLLTAILCSKDFIDYISKNGLLIIVKGNCLNVRVPYEIEYINDFLEDDSYDSLLLNSECLILTYTSDFRLRFSSVVYNCLYNNARFVVNNVVEGMISEREFGRRIPLFKSTKDLIQQIDRYRNA